MNLEIQSIVGGDLASMTTYATTEVVGCHYYFRGVIWNSHRQAMITIIHLSSTSSLGQCDSEDWRVAGMTGFVPATGLIRCLVDTPVNTKCSRDGSSRLDIMLHYFPAGVLRLRNSRSDIIRSTTLVGILRLRKKVFTHPVLHQCSKVINVTPHEFRRWSASFSQS